MRRADMKVGVDYAYRTTYGIAGRLTYIGFMEREVENPKTWDRTFVTRNVLVFKAVGEFRGSFPATADGEEFIAMDAKGVRCTWDSHTAAEKRKDHDRAQQNILSDVLEMKAREVLGCVHADASHGIVRVSLTMAQLLAIEARLK